MNVSWSTIISLVGIGVAVYATFDMITTNGMLTALKHTYATILLDWDSKFKSSKTRERMVDSPAALTDALQHLVAEQSRLEAELRLSRARQAALAEARAALAEVRQATLSPSRPDPSP
jgi:hypothetical protein